MYRQCDFHCLRVSFHWFFPVGKKKERETASLQACYLGFRCEPISQQFPCGQTNCHLNTIGVCLSIAVLVWGQEAGTACYCRPCTRDRGASGRTGRGGGWALVKESNEIDVRFLLCFVFKCLKKIKEIETSVNKSLHLAHVRSGFLMNILCLCVCARAR